MATAPTRRSPRRCSAASAGDTITVCPGTYTEDVTITEPLTLVGHNATIDATGRNNGITLLASKSTVEGFAVENAIGEGILLQGVSNDVISGNTVENNDVGNTSYPECLPTGVVPGDCGEGLHLMGVTDTTVTRNVVADNSGGILLSDEVGPTSGNLIAFNVVADNLSDCGVTIVGHHAGTPPHLGDPNWTTVSPTVAGVYDNTVTLNTIEGNGVGPDAEGGGVIIASGAPGAAVNDNNILHNFIEGNGLAGVTVHSHVPGAAQDLNGNVISGNLIKTNNLEPDQDFFPYWTGQNTTGVIVATASPLQITIKDNVIMKNTYGVWITPGVTITGGLSSNIFTGNNGRALCLATPQIGATPPGCS